MKIEILKHGTTYGYNNGCRCEDCKKAISIYRKNLKPKEHGTKWSYDLGCRCVLCKKAKSDYWHKLNPDTKLPTTDIEKNTRICTSCKKVKSLEEYGQHKGRLLDKMYECRICKNKRSVANKNKPEQRFSIYKSGARVRKIEFDLTFEQFMKFWNKPCYYCGEDINGIGLDRKNSKLGYNVENVLPCCSRCNRAKTIQTTEQFIAMCKKVAKKFQNHIVDST